ncbi:MAG: hypothetical protein KDD89_13595, partial [Anaerolineales bacterium]|nr:hypothetical protein [Anaerolineales bacterium]
MKRETTAVSRASGRGHKHKHLRWAQLLLVWSLVGVLVWVTWGNPTALLPDTAVPNASFAASTRPLPEAFYVDPAGSDTTGDGSASAPWQSIQHAVDSVPEGSVVRVRAGVYHGRVALTRRYKGGGLLLSADPPYQAQLRHDHQVIICFTCTDVTIEGFDMAHSGPGAERYVVQIQDTADDGSGGKQVTLRNNIFHDSYNNDLLKINNGAQQIRITGNLFYNQAGQDS